MATKKQKLRVVELFAGVGGFHVGFRQAGGFDVVWANQWEPATKKQHAFEIYRGRFPKTPSSNVDIAKVPTHEIPDHDILVGGFPCQDYSVARALSHATGLVGKKGVLWWQIERIIREKGKMAPSFLMLENVDRLLKSPVQQRGRDFAVMLASLADLGYIVEWRVINAAEYGMPQRRRRTYIVGYKKGTAAHNAIKGLKKQLSEWVIRNGIMAKAFPVKKTRAQLTGQFTIAGTLGKVSENFNRENPKKSPFGDAGILVGRQVQTWATEPKFSGDFTTLGDILQRERDVADEYFIKPHELKAWRYLKGAKKEPRGKEGFEYIYAEGPMVFPDDPKKASRTIITSEGGPGPSRFKHVVKTRSGKLRRLTPIELERLNMFPEHHTEGVGDTTRAFLMGNALVVGIVKKIARRLRQHHNEN